MSMQHQQADTFHSLHVPGRPLVLFNIWDAGSARAVAQAGAPAIATGSWSVAAANGLSDGENVPLEFALENLRRIVAATELPVTIDLESGYGATPDDVAVTVTKAIAAGAIGCNIEDSFPHDGSLRETGDQADRIAAARRAADSAGLPFFINARTDVYFQKDERTKEGKVAEVIERAEAYASAGASGLFVPGLGDADSIARIVKATALPVNIMAGPGTPPLAELAGLGVARVSHGPGPLVMMMQALEEAARTAMAR